MNKPLNHDENLQFADRIAYLIFGHVGGTLTEPEQDELDEWIVESDANLELFEKLTNEDNIEAAMHTYQVVEKEKAAALANLKRQIENKKGIIRRIRPYLAAAAVILIAGSIFLLKRSHPQKQIEKPIAHITTNAIPPGSDKAVLTLSDGRTVILDSGGSGPLASEGTITIIKGKEGQIIYDGTGSEMKYNVVSTPRGGQYAIVLGDGTKVWLNAESSLKYPAGFADSSREVQLKGEAYFEVAKNPSRPFRLTVTTSSGNGGIVEVLGTHFNVNGYNDEGTVKTTLLEGSVRVRKDGKSQIIAPGEQAIANGGIKVIKADVAEETAWKNGRFLFRDATIHTIGEQLKRWYDVSVEYQGGNIDQHFNLEISRDVELSKILDGFQGTGQVHFILQGKKLIIKP